MLFWLYKSYKYVVACLACIIFHGTNKITLSVCLFVFAMFIFRPIRLRPSDSSCSICRSSCGVSVHRNMSSAKRRLERNYPSIFTPLFSHFNLLNMLSNVALNNVGDMVPPLSYSSLDPDFLTLSVQMYCHWAVRKYVFQDFYVHIFYSLFLQWCQYCLGLYWVECLLVIHENNTQWYVVFTALLFKLVYVMYVICRRVLAPKSCLFSMLSFIWFFSSLVVVIFVNSLYIFDSKQIGL